MNTIDKLIKSHRSVRRYQQENNIDEEVILDMIRVAQHASSSHFVQAYSIIMVSDQELKERLSSLSSNSHVATCNKFLLFCADLERLNIACNMHGKVIESQSAENLLVATIDTALVAQNFSLIAESRGYGICFIGGMRNEPILISELLKLPKKVFPLFGMAIGIPDEQNEVKPRLPIESIVHKDFYDSSQYEAILKFYDQQMKVYYQSRSENKKDIGWSEPMSDYMSHKNRMDMMKHLNEKGFNRD
ncbi:NADPH-dependent oxidoreductase [Ignatzschineria rhizosphaerae]|uniref:NADPH-dependent oxidoreductase n=1 Tax=Ignatzschineria rhizosphaerae TaxID=2923279 RepID=A0ABY3X4K3_9GAMM|nr:NADPH-dependent oxidoreductase [Ignatzschineria rhizosphaerae]UNM96392.1 NADPH-dependent oxidoreductase [Ignatzschineria rhizosphaerae]